MQRLWCHTNFNLLGLLTLVFSIQGCGLGDVFKVQNSFSGDALYGNPSGSIPIDVLADNKCFQCHSTWANYTTDAQWIANESEIIDPGNPLGSTLYLRISGDQSPIMPPSNIGPPLSSGDLSAVYEWIENMSP
jgi:hypothetical protein